MVSISQETRTIRILVPTGRIKTLEEKRVAGVANIQNKILGLLDNRKPNFDVFLDKLKVRLSEYHPAEVRLWNKPEAGKPAPQATIEDMAGKINLALTGSAD